MDKKEYLGDGAYVHNDGFHIILETSDGRDVTNEIYLEPAVVQNLLKYMDKQGIKFPKYKEMVQI